MATARRDEEHTPLLLSLGTRMGAATLLILLALTVVIYFKLSRFERERLLGAKEQAARMAEQLFIRSAAVPILFEDETGMSDTVALLEREPEVLGVQIWKVSHGQIGLALVEQLKRESRAVSPRLVEQLVNERQSDRLLLRDVVRDPDDNIIAVAAVQFSLASENLAYSQLRMRILCSAAAVALVLALLLWRIMRRSILAPLARLLAAIRRVEEGQSATALAVSRDEIGRLAGAFGRMASAVARREQDIAHRNEDMKLVLDNVGQAFLVIDRQGHIAAERSAIVDHWFGAPRAGETIGSYVGRIDARAANLWLLAIDSLTDGFTPLEVVLGQLPERLTCGDRHYACRFHPVLEGEELRQLVLVVADVTAEVEHDRAEAAQRDVMAAVGKLMADRTGFANFLDEANGLVKLIVEAGADVDRSAHLRDLHTLKGLAAVFGVASIATLCHGLEDQAADSGTLAPIDSRQMLDRRWQELVQKVTLLGGTARPVVELTSSEYAELTSAVETHWPHPRLVALIRSFAEEPVRPRLERLGEHAVALARRLGKCAVQIDLDDTRLRLPRQPWSTLWPTLVHLVRNAVDHGLESAADRASAGKSEIALLTLSAHVVDGSVHLLFADDGRGVDWERLREKAGALGMRAETQDDLVAALFADGVSTRDAASTTSGRGVGLSAVWRSVASLRGTIEVASTPGRGTRFEISIPLNALEQAA